MKQQKTKHVENKYYQKTFVTDFSWFSLWEESKFDREVNAYKVITSIPVPRVLSIKKSISSMRLSICPGTSIDEIDDLNVHLLFRVGEILAIIHQTPVQNAQYNNHCLANVFDKYSEALSGDELHLAKWNLFKMRFSESDLRETTFIHGDFHGGNVIVHSSEITGIIDWEENVLSHSYLDIASMIHYLLWRYSSSISSQAIEQFLRGYHQGWSGSTQKRGVFPISQQRINLFLDFLVLRQSIIGLIGPNREKTSTDKRNR